MKWQTYRSRATPPPFDSTYWRQIVTETVSDFNQRDPRAGCWDWIQENNSNLWQEHKAAMKDLDQAYQQQDTGKIEKTVSRAKDTCTAMFETWSNRNHHLDPDSRLRGVAID